MNGMKYLAMFSFLSIMGMAIISGCTEEKDDDEISILVAGEEISLDVIFGDHPSITVEGTNMETYEGVSLGVIINQTSLPDPEDHQFKITASDGWNKIVTWNDMMTGILIKEDTMTVFPGLPGKYRITDVVSIETVEAPTILVNGHLFVWQQLFHIIEDPVTMQGNGSDSYEGIPISQVINITELEDQASHDFIIKASGDYFKNVTWEDLTKGILILDERMSFFPHLSQKYRIKDIVEIEVV